MITEIFSNRNSQVDILKGIAITLMVIGHSGCPTSLHKFIYIFHMPLFFFISGYLFKWKYMDVPFMFVLRRVKTCYVPFVKYSLIFLLCHELFVPLGFFSHYSILDYERQIEMILLMSKTELFLGPYWFLIEMLVASFFFVMFVSTIQMSLRLKWVSNHVFLSKPRWIMGVIFLSVICMLFLSLSHIHLPKVSVRTFLAVFYMALGQCWKMSENKIRISLLSSIIFISVLLLVSILPLSVGSKIDGGMGVSTVKEISLYLPLSLLGIFGVWRISSNIKNNVLLVLERYGKNSFHILTWHFLLFAIILNILFLCRCENFPSFEFPIARSRWWFVISILSMSLITGFMFLKDLLFNKQKKKNESQTKCSI